MRMTQASHIKRVRCKASSIAECARLLCVISALSFISCSRHSFLHTPPAGGGEKAGGVNIAATFYPLYIMCLNITDGADGVNVSCLAPPNAGCLHDYSLTTRDAARLEAADIIAANGLGLESFLGSVLEAKGEKVIIASEGFGLTGSAASPLQEAGNPHIWVSVAGARHEAGAIAAGLERLDEGRAALYAANAAKYDEELSALEKEMHEMLLPFAGRKIVTFHEAFPYFAREFSLDVLSVIEREPGSVPSAKEMAETIKVIKEAIAKGAPPALFAEPQYPSLSAELIEAETGLPVRSLDPLVTGEMKKDAYINAQRENAKTLVKAFED